MNASEILTTLGLGLLLGTAGQVIRAVAGLQKKTVALPGPGVSEPQPHPQPLPQQPEEPFSWSRFGVSLILGGVAGMLAAVMLSDRMDNINQDVILGLVAAGYAGSDFLEGIIKWLPAPPPKK